MTTWFLLLACYFLVTLYHQELLVRSSFPTQRREGRFVEVQIPDRLGSCSRPESLCATTTCCSLPRRVMGLRSHPRGPRKASYARSSMRTFSRISLPGTGDASMFVKVPEPEVRLET